jgi:cytochrome c peroxidase
MPLAATRVGRFKAPSLRNLGVRGRFGHDGGFASLAEVVEFYSSGVQPHVNLDGRLRGAGGAPIRANFTTAETDAKVAFLNALTDTAFLSDPRIASPFPTPRPGSCRWR